MKKYLNSALVLFLICGFFGNSFAFQREKPEKRQDKSPLKTVKILHSGFMARDTLVIKYRESDKKIIEIKENGEIVPEERFGEFESKFFRALELDQIAELTPLVEDLKYDVLDVKLYEQNKIAKIKLLMDKVIVMESDISTELKDQLLQSITVYLDRLADKTQRSTELTTEEKIARINETLYELEELKKYDDRSNVVTGLAFKLRNNLGNIRLVQLGREAEEINDPSEKDPLSKYHEVSNLYFNF
ncbi:MAG: hypothetical protein GY863_10915, partial [bacterium]|nr:hypothetical protein [bacterium]